MATRDTVRSFVTSNFYVAESGVSDESSLIGCGIVDSTGVLEVVTFLEQTFGVVIDDHEMLPENLDSIARITAFVERKRGEAR
jgi:acyl carrier protein